MEVIEKKDSQQRPSALERIARARQRNKVSRPNATSTGDEKPSAGVDAGTPAISALERIARARQAGVSAKTPLGENRPAENRLANGGDRPGALERIAAARQQAGTETIREAAEQAGPVGEARRTLERTGGQFRGGRVEQDDADASFMGTLGRAVKRGAYQTGSSLAEVTGTLLDYTSDADQEGGPQLEGRDDESARLAYAAADALGERARAVERSETSRQFAERARAEGQRAAEEKPLDLQGVPGWVQDRYLELKGYRRAAEADPAAAMQFASETGAEAAPSLALTGGAGKATAAAGKGTQALAMWLAGSSLETGANLRDAATDPETGERRDVTTEGAAAAAAGGSASGALEALGAAGVGKAIRKTLGATSLDETAQREAAQAIGQRLKTYAAEAAKGSQTEGAAEALQTVISDVAAQQGWDPGRELGEGWVESYLAGAMLGGGAPIATGAAGEAAQGVRQGIETLRAPGERAPGEEDAGALPTPEIPPAPQQEGVPSEVEATPRISSNAPAGRDVLRQQFEDEARPVRNRIESLYDFSRAHPEEANRARMNYGEVSEEEARRVQDAVGLDVRGYRRTIDGSSIRHMHKKHGSFETEDPRGQVPVTREDFARIPEIVASSDRIEPGETVRGVERIVHVKRENGTVYFVEEQRTGQNELAAVTIRKKKSGGSGALGATGEAGPAPPGVPQTSAPAQENPTDAPLPGPPPDNTTQQQGDSSGGLSQDDPAREGLMPEQSLPESLTEGEYFRQVASESTDPLEIARAYRQARDTEQAQRTNDPQAEAIEAAGPYRTASFDQFGDPNQRIGPRSGGSSIAMRYLAGEGKDLDAAAQEITGSTGIETTPQDIADYITSQAGASEASLSDRLRARYREVTGGNLTERRLNERLAPTETERARSETPYGDAPEAPFAPVRELGKGSAGRGKGLPPQGERIPVRGEGRESSKGRVRTFKAAVQDLEAAAGVVVERARMPSGMAGSYRTADARTTSRSGRQDLDTAVHEIGHALDDKYRIAPPDLDASTAQAIDEELIPQFSQHGSGGSRYDPGTKAYERAEGVAEFVRAYAADPEAATAAAPRTAARLKEALAEGDPSGAAMQGLERFGRDLRRFAGASERGEAGATLANVRQDDTAGGVLERVKRRLRSLTQSRGVGDTVLDRIKQEFTDDLALPLKAWSHARDMQGLPDEAASPDDDFEMLYRLYQGAGAQYGEVLESGMIDAEYETATPGGADWLLGPLQSREDKQNVVALLIAERQAEKGGALTAAAERVQALTAEMEAMQAEGGGIAEARQSVRKAEGLLQEIRQAQRLGKPQARGMVGPQQEEVRKAKQKLREAMQRYRGIEADLAEARRELGGRRPYQGPAERAPEVARRRAARLTGIGGGVFSDQEQAQRFIERLKEDTAAYERAREAAGRYRQWMDSLLRFWVGKGRLSQEKYEQIRAKNQYYVPLSRIMEDEYADSVMRLAYDTAPDAFQQSGKITQGSKLLYRFQGSTREIEDPYAMLLQQTQAFLKEGERNSVMQAFAAPFRLTEESRALHEGGVMDLATIAREVESDTPDKQTVYFDGEPVHFKLHPAVQDAFDSLSPEESGTLARLGQKFASLSRNAITLSPPFLIRQQFRDPVERAIKGESGLLDHITGQLTKAQRRRWEADKREFLRLGGGMFGYQQRGKDGYYNEMRRLMDEKFGEGDIITTFSRMGDSYRRFAERGEIDNRVAEYRKVRDRLLGEGADPMDARMQAAERARGLIDFAKVGRTVQQINKYVPFVNAHIQGLLSTSAALKRTPGRVMARWALYALLPDLLAYLWNARDEESREAWEQEPRYLKDFYYTFHIPGTDRRLRIPKSYEFGAASAFFVRSLNAIQNADEEGGAEGESFEGEAFGRAFEGYGETLKDTFVPLTPRGVLTAPTLSPVQAALNYDAFREKQIVSPWESKLDLELREGTRYASPLGRLLQPVFQVDARKIDFLAENLAGGFGQLATSASEELAGEASGQSRSFLDQLGGLTVRPAAYGARDVQFVTRWAERRGEKSDARVKKLSDMIGRYYDAEDVQRARRERERLVSYARRIRARIEREQERGSN